MFGDHISQLGMIIDDNGNRVILPIGYLSQEEAEKASVPYIVVSVNGSGYFLDFDSELLPRTCHLALVLKKLSGLTLQMALRKAAKIMQNAIEEVGITELVSVPKMGKPFFLEDCISTEEAQSSYRKVLESLLLFEAMISYDLWNQREIDLFLQEMLEFYPQRFASYAKLKIPEWVSPQRSLGARTISSRHFSVVFPDSQVSFLESLEAGDPCVLIREERDRSPVRLSFYFEGKLVSEKRTLLASTAGKVALNFVKENLV